MSEIKQQKHRWTVFQNAELFVDLKKQFLRLGFGEATAMAAAHAATEVLQNPPTVPGLPGVRGEHT